MELKHYEVYDVMEMLPAFNCTLWNWNFAVMNLINKNRDF